MNNQTDKIIARFNKIARFQAGIYDGVDTAAYRVQQWLKRQTMELCGETNSLLDAGCGNGDFLEMFAMRHSACALTGIDISSDMIDIARKRAQKPGLNMNFRAGSLTAIPAEDGEVETLISIGVLLYIHPSERDLAYSELCRVASKTLILEIKNTLSPYYPIRQLSARYGKWKMRIYGTNPVLLSASLKKYQFQLVATKGILPGFFGFVLSPVLLCKFEKM